MSVRQKTICRLCLKVLRNTFLLIDETSRQGLDVLSVKMNFDVSSDPLMCEDCAKSIKKSLSFILVCLNSEKSILLLDTEKDKINIADICRFCMKKSNETNFIALDDVMKDNTYLHMFDEYMFKMDLNIIKNPLICFHCRDSMEGYFKFLRNCYDTEEKINTYQQNEQTGSCGKVTLSKVFKQLSKSTPEYSESTQVGGVKKGKPTMQDVAEIEFIDIHEPMKEVKEESTIEEEVINSLLHPNDDQNDFVICSYDPQDCSCQDCIARKPVAAPPVTEDITTKPKCSEVKTALTVESEKFPSKNKVTRNKKSLTMQNAEGTMYKCAVCDYQTTKKKNFKRHSLCHKPDSEVRMYKCTVCNFKTKHLSSFKSHSLTHKTEAEITMYKCTICDYKTKHKRSLTSHSLSHKAEAEITMHRCASCDYKTKHKSNLKIHLLSHMSEEEVPVYRCTACDYKSKHKSSFKNHLLSHTNDEEVKMFRCTFCDFKTKRKNGLKIHSLIHKTEAEVTMYKCTSCDYKTIYKDNVKRHSLIHKTEAEVRMYNCTVCDYKTKHKRCLQNHSLTHKDQAELIMHECTACDFKSKYKKSLNRHFLTHKAQAEVAMYNYTW